MEPVRSRVRFQEAAEESEPENFASEKEAGAATSSAPAAAASAAAAGIVPLRFELQEDPSFWKDNNIQVLFLALAHWWLFFWHLSLSPQHHTLHHTNTPLTPPLSSF